MTTFLFIATMALFSGSASAFDFNGIVSLGGCSGSLVSFAHSQPSDAALVLTNGHCTEGGFPAPGGFKLHVPSSRMVSILAADGRRIGRESTVEIVYATMTHTDLALYRLKKTYAELESQYGVEPLTLSPTRPTLQLAIEIISGAWKTAYGCNIEAFVHGLEEDGYQFTDSIRYSRPGCEVIGGTSGSPVLAAGTRTVVAVNNTGNEDGQRCTRNNPCEIDEQGAVTYHKGYSYAQQTFWLYACIDSARQFDLNLADCALTGGRLAPVVSGKK